MFGALGLTGVLGYSGMAAAASNDCLAIHEDGQREAKAGRLRLAKQLFTCCNADDECSEYIRKDCTEFLLSVQHIIPTVIFSVSDDKSADILDVKVYSNDELITESLDGRSIEVDPGKHQFRFVLPWGAVLTHDVLIREGEKRRLIQLTVRGPNPESNEAGEVDSSGAKAKVAPTTPVAPRLGAWITSGAALIGFGVGTTFAILGSSRKSDLDTCAPSCDSDMRGTYEDWKRAYLIADISFAAGIASAGIATHLFLAPRKENSVGVKTGRFLDPFSVVPTGVVFPGGGAFGVQGQF